MKLTLSILATALFALTLATQAEAVTDSPKAGLAALSQAIAANNAAAARTRVTGGSRELFDRFAGYGLLRCLPGNAAYLSQEGSGSTRLVRASLTGVDGTKQIAGLTFRKEESLWRFDLPASLQRALGEKWRNKVALTEQLYLLLRQQMGEKLDCAAIQDLVKG